LVYPGTPDTVPTAPIIQGFWRNWSRPASLQLASTYLPPLLGCAPLTYKLLMHEVVFKIGSYSVSNCDVVIDGDFFAGKTNGTMSIAATALVVSYLLLSLAQLMKSLSPNHFRRRL